LQSFRIRSILVYAVRRLCTRFYILKIFIIHSCCCRVNLCFRHCCRECIRVFCFRCLCRFVTLVKCTQCRNCCRSSRRCSRSFCSRCISYLCRCSRCCHRCFCYCYFACFFDCNLTSLFVGLFPYFDFGSQNCLSCLFTFDCYAVFLFLRKRDNLLAFHRPSCLLNLLCLNTFHCNFLCFTCFYRNLFYQRWLLCSLCLWCAKRRNNKRKSYSGNNEFLHLSLQCLDLLFYVFIKKSTTRFE